MAERTGPEAANLAFSDAVEALGRYLHACGWTSLVLGGLRIHRRRGPVVFGYEIVVTFAGAKPDGQDVNVPRSTSETSGV